MSALKNFSSIIVNHHRFIYRGVKTKYFTPGKKYEITKVFNEGYSLHTKDDEGHEHTLGLNYFNQYCVLIDIECEILEKFDDLENALIDKDLEKFSDLALTILAELKESIAIKDRDVTEGSHFESKGQFAKAVMFDGNWCLLRQPKAIAHCPMLEAYATKQLLVNKLNEKNYKKIA